MRISGKVMALAWVLLLFGSDAALAHPFRCTSAITSNFNGTAIAGGDFVWFNGVVKVSGLRASPATIFVTHATITFSANGKTYLLPVPDSEITFSTSTTLATTHFEVLSKEIGSPLGWDTDLPFAGLAGNDFLAAVTFRVPAGGLPGGVKNVIWQATFSSNTSGLTVNWQWGRLSTPTSARTITLSELNRSTTTKLVSFRTPITQERQKTSSHL
jgi:hypothetical protein